MSYRDQVRNYISTLKRDFGEYVPRDFDESIFEKENVPDNILWLAARQYKMETKAKYEEKTKRVEQPDDELLLVPYKLGNGDILYVDKNSGRKLVHIYRNSDGTVTYRGKKEYLTMLGGRNELGGIIKMMEDGDLFHDTPGK